MDFNESLLYLEGLSSFGIKLGLERVAELCRLLGNPQNKYKTIHITGTNGKGSVSFTLARLFTEAKIKAGCYSSPHLVRYNERMMINGEEISDEDFAAVCSAVRLAAEEMIAAGGEPPTQFEVMTVMAFLFFAEEDVEYAVIEAGLGGLLDSTNIILPEITIITNVAMEHADHCGGTLEGIARHKAGIIKDSVPLITGAAGMPLEIIRERAAELSVDTFIYGEDFRAENSEYHTVEGGGKYRFNQRFTYTSMLGFNPVEPFELGLKGMFQTINMSLVITAGDLLARDDDRITIGALRRTIANVRVPARFELFYIGSQPIIVDGAHNPAGMIAIRNSLDIYLPDDNELGRVFILGVLRDKDVEEMVRKLVRPADTVISVRPASERAAGTEVVSAVAAAMGAKVFSVDNIAGAIAKAREESMGRLIVACGSLYLVGGVREALL